MKTKKTYTVNVGNVGNMEYTSKKLAIECYKTYVTLSKNNEGRAAKEPVILFEGEDILMEYTPEIKLRSILDFKKCQDLINNAIDKNDSCVILCPNYSINIASKYEDSEELNYDLEELSDYLGHFVQVSDYNDLIVDLSNNED